MVSIICLALILISYRFSKGFFYKNIVVYFLYNGVLYYKLFFHSKSHIDTGVLFSKKRKRVKNRRLLKIKSNLINNNLDKGVSISIKQLSIA